MTADRLNPTAHQAAEAPADPRPAWDRIAYTWLEREVDGGHQVDPAALAAEVSVTPTTGQRPAASAARPAPTRPRAVGAARAAGPRPHHRGVPCAGAARRHPAGCGQ